MEARISFALPQEMKQKLDDLAHETSIKEGCTVTNGELIRRALVKTYKIGSVHSDEPKKRRHPGSK